MYINCRSIKRKLPFILFVCIVALLVFFVGLLVGEYRSESIHRFRTSPYLHIERKMNVNVERVRSTRVHTGVVIGKFKTKQRTSTIKQKNDISISMIAKYVKGRYMEIRKLDSPAMGDFDCTGTDVVNSCAFYVASLEEAKNMCDDFLNLCKGFVLAISAKVDGTPEYLAYMKTDIGNMASNVLTDFFVKTRFIKELKYKST